MYHVVHTYMYVLYPHSCLCCTSSYITCLHLHKCYASVEPFHKQGNVCSLNYTHIHVYVALSLMHVYTCTSVFFCIHVHTSVEIISSKMRKHEKFSIPCKRIHSLFTCNPPSQVLQCIVGKLDFNPTCHGTLSKLCCIRNLVTH